MRHVLLFILTISLITACAAPQEDEFVVGAILSLTGAVADHGIDFKQGMELAIEEINPDIVFEFQDSASLPATGVTAAQQLIATKNIDVMVSMLSAVSVPLVPLAEENNIPLISSLVANNGFAASSPNTFRIFAKAEQINSKAIEFFEKNLE